ncbi:MAG TPA: hypothetical protein PKI26_02025 [Methanothrix sp.]|jgi:hypothetical protein|nr:hypothetical protein [Methanothrix sp.]
MGRYIISVLLLLVSFAVSIGTIFAEDERTGDVDAFLLGLEQDGFIVQEGKFGLFDVIDLFNAGYLDSCYGNNPSTPYMLCFLPPQPGEKTINQYVGDADTLDNETLVEFRLRPDEALLFIGRTPPECKYFSFRSYIYDRYFPEDGKRKRIFASLGDPLNLLTLKTDGDSPFNASTVILMAADEKINDRVISAGIAAGFPESIMNTDIIPPQLVRMGLDQEDDKFLMLIRMAFFEDQEAGKEYMNGTAARVFRLTPMTVSSTIQPYGTPALRVRGTGNTSELNLTSTLDELRIAILKENEGANVTELTTQVWLYEGYDALQRGIDVIGENRDTSYLRTDNFNLGSNEFLIVYGINHAMTGKATYCNFGVYGADILNGIGAVADMNLTGTADKYLPGNPLAKYLYVYKVSRNCTEPNCLFVPWGVKAHGIELDQPAFVGFRAYLEQATKSGPIWSEIVYDRAIKFDPKK